MRLVANWRGVLKHAASVKLIVLAALLSGFEAALPFLDGWLPIRPGVFALLTLLVTVAAFIARIVAQKALDRPTDPQWETGDPE